MDNKKSLSRFLEELNNDFIIGTNHLIDDLPNIFTTKDLLFFYINKDKFWTYEDEEKNLKLCIAMTEFYLSVLLHISSSQFKFREDIHSLEYSILYGDLLSGAFAKKLVDMGELETLKRWLIVLSKIQQNLVVLSLEDADAQRKKILLSQTIYELISSEKFICNESISNATLFGITAEEIQEYLRKYITSKNDVMKMLLGE